MTSSIYLPRALATKQPQQMPSRQQMACIVQAERWVPFGSCGLPPLSVESATSRSAHCWLCLVVLCRVELRILGESLHRQSSLRPRWVLSPDLSPRMFQAGRFIAGLGIGVLVTICPMYMSELAPPEKRGWLVGHHAIFLVFGYMLSAWLGYATYFATTANPSFAWRFPLCMQCFAPLVLFATSFFIPRSPRWLLQMGKTEEAWQTLLRLRNSPDDPDNLVAKEELYQTKEQLALDATKLQKLNTSPWQAVLKIKSYRKRMIIGFLTQWGAEFSGPLVIVRPLQASNILVGPLLTSSRIITRSFSTQILAKLAQCLSYCLLSGSQLLVRSPLLPHYLHSETG